MSSRRHWFPLVPTGSRNRSLDTCHDWFPPVPEPPPLRGGFDRNQSEAPARNHTNHHHTPANGNQS